MTDLETRLDRALRVDALEARDPMFRIQVMERRAQTALRRRLLSGLALAFGVAVAAALALAIAETVLDGQQRLTAMVVIGATMTALLAAPYLGGASALRGLAQRASFAIRTLPRMRGWL